MKRKNTHQGNLLDHYRGDISRCVKCGVCGAVCPSYLRERDESFSARGRMTLIKAVLDGRLTVSRIFKDRLATCMTCLACEASCPSGVPVTELIQAAKEQAVAESGMGLVNSVIAGAVKQPAFFRAAAWLAPVALHYNKGQGESSKLALEGFNRGFKACPRRLLSGVQSSKERVQEQGPKGKVAFFAGCAVNYFQQDIGRSLAAVLNTIGYEVIIPEDVKCCGRPLLSLGDRRAAEELAAHNAALLEALEADAIVTGCASCGLTFKKEYPKLLRPGVKTPVVFDIHDFLSGKIAGIKLNPVRKNVTIHDPCHLGRGQGLSRTVRDLLQAIPGLTLVEMRDADRCCGFGGVMRVTNRGLSDGIAEDKVRNIFASNASVVATGCPGCRMQITDALRRHGSDIKVAHPVQLLEESLRIAELEMTGPQVKGPGSRK